MPYAALGDALLRPGRSFAESPDGGDTWVYSGKGLEATAVLVRPCHSSRQSLGHSSIRIAESSKGPRARGSLDLPSRSGYLVEDAEGFLRDQSLLPVLANHTDKSGSWFALSNLRVFSKEPIAKAWVCLTAPEDWRGMHPTALAVLNL
jgi:hypothetical protein